MSRWWRSHSVRVRLTVWYVAVMVVVLAVYAVAVYTFVSRSVSQALDDRLRADFYWAAATVDEGPGGLVMPGPQVDLLLEQEAPWVQVWSDDGRELLLMNGEAMRRPLPDTQRLATRSEDSIVSFATAGAPMRVMSGRSYVCPCVEDPQTGALIGNRRVIVQVARSEEAMRQQVRDLLLILVLGLPLAVGVAGLGGYVLASRALAPIEQMTARARTITAERLADRLPVANPENEMGRLATVFNETLGRLEASFDQMRRFTTDVSHELRTPLTAIRSVGEVGLRGHRDEAAYRGIIGSMLEEVDRLASLVDRLLDAVARRDAPGEAVARRRRSLGACRRCGVASVGARRREATDAEHRSTGVAGRRRPIDWCCGRRSSTWWTTRSSSRRRRGGCASGSPRRRRTPSSRSSTPGPASRARPASASSIASTARDDSNGSGTGLGLSLAKGAVEALGGHLTLASTGATGSAFRISLPRLTSSGMSVGRLAEPASYDRDRGVTRVTVRHLTRDELEAGLESIRNSPTDNGVVELIVSRPRPSAARGAGTRAARSRRRAGRRQLGHARARCRTRTTQLNVMNARVIALIAQDKARWPLAGDQLFVDLDLADDNLPPGSQIEIGERRHRGQRGAAPGMREVRRSDSAWTR